MIRVNGIPLNNVKPEGLRLKLQEPILLAGKNKFRSIDMRIRVRGGGHTSQIFAIRQAIAKAVVSYTQKFVDEPVCCPSSPHTHTHTHLHRPSSPSRPRTSSTTVPSLSRTRAVPRRRSSVDRVPGPGTPSRTVKHRAFLGHRGVLLRSASFFFRCCVHVLLRGLHRRTPCSFSS